MVVEGCLALSDLVGPGMQRRARPFDADHGDEPTSLEVDQERLGEIVEILEPVSGEHSVGKP